MADEKVLVIGGGMAGLAVANGLKKAGISFVVFERDAEDRRRQGYQLGLQDMGVAALRNLGCDAVTEIIARDDTLTRVRLASASKTGVVELLEFGTGDSGIIDRRSLAALLRAPVREHVLFGKRLLRFEPGPGGSGVTAHFDDGTSESGSLLVGADGVKSAVRKQLFPDLEASFREDTRVGSFAFNIECERLEALGNAEVSRLVKLGSRSLLRILGPDAMSFLFMGYRDQEDGEREKITFVFNHNIDAEGEVTTLPELRQKLAGKCAPLEAIFGCVSEGDNLIGGVSHVFSSRAVTVASLGSFAPAVPVVLIGDAIHPMTTHRGLGANTAFVDAQELVDRIKSNRASLVREMWKSVCARGAKAVGESLSSTRSLHIASPWSRWLRDWILWSIGRLFDLKRLFI